jgi:hypothetical protein
VRQQSSQTALAPGTMLAKRYRIEQLIGSGGYGNVYRGSDIPFGYDRAIKEVVDTDAGVRDQFRLEAELLINSVHPNIPHGYHILEENGRLYLVMDYVKGRDLEDLLNESLTKRQRPLDEEQVLEWAIAICGALDEMHNRRVPVIHRDIKPANIKITTDGEPILIDFGLAKLHLHKGPTMTAAQGVSPGFAPPEQYMAKGRTDARTDIYGLGATLYACLTGKDPPEAPGRLLAQTGAGGTHGMHLMPIRKFNPHVSDATERVVLRALELSPGNRQHSARQLRDELHDALARLRTSQPATAVMDGIPCHRCGALNAPEALRCAHCGGPLSTAASGKHAALAPDASGKRAAVPVGLLSSAKMPVPAQVGAEASGRGRPGRQPVAAVPATAKQQTVGAVAADPGPRTNKQRAVPRGVGGTAPSLPALNAVRTTREGAAVPALPPNPGKSPVRPPADPAAPVAAPAGSDARKKSWIKLGTTELRGFGKFLLAAAAIEALWGALVIGLSVIQFVYGQHPPALQIAAGWVGFALLASLLGGQVLTRPIYRRGTMGNGRRVLQAAIILIYSIAVQAAGVWGVMEFRTQSASPTLAVVSYVLFGVSCLLAGIVGIVTALG